MQFKNKNYEKMECHQNRMSPETPTYIIVNFGGPRDLDEIPSFLQELLTDRDVVRTRLPKYVHNFLFRKIAQRRAKKIAKDYEEIGGKSPIYFDTEELAKRLREKLKSPVLTFHRYLPKTHEAFKSTLLKTKTNSFTIFPMFPQFTYATTGSIARWFLDNIPYEIVNRMRWIKSYSSHPHFISSYQKTIHNFLNERQLQEEECLFLFSAHGLPISFVEKGDPYEKECQLSFSEIMKAFPKALGTLCFQSKFGPGEWLKPYTVDICNNILSYCQEKRHILFVPISFTSDHIETLFEIEKQYVPIIQEKGLNVYRVPALNLREDWIEGIVDILKGKNFCNTEMLISRRCPFLSFLGLSKI